MGTNLIQLSCHTLRDQTHPTATATHAGTNHIQHIVATNHIQLPNTWVPITSNNHCHTRRHQTHSTVITIYVGANQINCYCLTRVPRTTPNCHSHNCGHKPHQTGNQPRGYQSHPIVMPHTWASNTSNCHSHTRGHQPHPTGTTRFVSTNHIQLPCPHT